jgi:hypothetical protein
VQEMMVSSPSLRMLCPCLSSGKNLWITWKACAKIHHQTYHHTISLFIVFNHIPSLSITTFPIGLFDGLDDINENVQIILVQQLLCPATWRRWARLDMLDPHHL